MKVFNACCKVLKRHMNAALIYVAIFLGIAVLMTTMSYQQQTDSYSGTKTTFAIINRDKESSVLIQGLTAYLAEKTDMVDLPDEKKAMQDALFYHAADYILIIPEGFADGMMNGRDVKLEKVTVPASSTAYYTDSLVDQYLNLVKMYRTAAPQMDETRMVSAVADDLSKQAPVEKIQYGGTQSVDERLQVYFRMMSYILMVLIILSISTVTMAFNRPEVRMRNLCSPLKLLSINAQLVLSNTMVAVICWAVLVGMGFIIFGQNTLQMDPRVLALLLLNSFVFMLVVMGMAFLASQFISNLNVQNAVANFIGLGLSFLGGAFVPIELLGSEMLAVARFTPNYWFISTVDNLFGMTAFTPEKMNEVWVGMLMQIGFAVAFLSVALLVSKTKRQSNNGFGRTATELEA